MRTTTPPFSMLGLIIKGELIKSGRHKTRRAKNGRRYKILVRCSLILSNFIFSREYPWGGQMFG
jgi:hypothetical protein